jgi:hypothetical protein
LNFLIPRSRTLVNSCEGWLDASGAPQEKIYDVGWSGDRLPDPTSGKLPPVGSTVDIAEAMYSNAIGAPFLEADWSGPITHPIRY